MISQDKPILRFGSQSAGPDGGFTIAGYSVPLAAAVGSFVKPSYGPEVKILGITLRIDGSLHSWGAAGPEPPSWSAREKSGRINYVVPERLWKGKRHEEVRTNFLEAMDEGVGVLLRCLENKGVEFDSESFLEDWQQAKADYLLHTVEKPRRGFRTPSGKWINPKGF